MRKETRSKAQRVLGETETIEAARGALRVSFITKLHSACKCRTGIKMTTHLCIKASSPKLLPSTHVATFLPNNCLSPLSASIICPSFFTNTSN